MKFVIRRFWLLGAIAISVIVLLTLFAAPNNNQITRGSTYSRSPEGYGAWYAFMEKRETPVKRWQKPFSDLSDREEKTPIALLRVNSELSQIRIGDFEKQWLAKGNTLAILGIQQPVTKANFTTIQESLAGSVKIETRRRLSMNEKKTPSENPKNAKNETLIQSQLLGDRFGAVVWQEKIGKGRLIYATTPYLAANAYQDAPGNYEFLAQLLLTQTGQSIWVDEYMHGYRDDSVGDGEKIRGNWLNYLAKTPLSSGILQASIILIVLLWAQNRRFGQPQPLETPVIDNSEAYIQALASVLQKAQSSEFVLDVLGKEEQLQFQKALGLGTVLLEPDELATAWVQQTGRSPAELQQLLQLQAEKFRIRESDLLNWLEKWQKVRQHSG